MSTAGCIIPTPLSQQPAPVNSPPKILTDEVMPTYGVAFTRTQTQSFTFSVAASDDDVEDTLLARLLFSSSPTEPAHYVDQITLTPPSNPSDDTVRSGTFGGSTGHRYCSFLSGTTVVYVAVTDHTFSNGDGDQTLDNDSDRDEISWVMTCTD